MKEPSRRWASYNFVPFPEHILYRYADPSRIPAHNRIDPALKTGEIRIRLTTCTPTFVGMDRTHFCRDPQGRLCIPGSTIRGLIRGNAQILSMASLTETADFDDRRFCFRAIPESGNRTGRADESFYRQRLALEDGADPDGVRAGYLVKEGRYYQIRPARGRWIRLSRQDPLLKKYREVFAQTQNISYELRDGRVTRLTEKLNRDMQRGVLLFPDQSENPEEGSVYLFPEPDRTCRPIAVPQEDERVYTEDVHWRMERGAEKLGFYELPRKIFSETMFPVFYIQWEEQTPDQRTGKPTRQHVFFGRTRCFRIPYPHTIRDGVPCEADPDQTAFRVDYPMAMFGYVRGQQCRRSRVSFGDLPAPEQTRTEPEVRLLRRVPRPSSCANYLEDGKTYADGDFRLRGYKQYWMKQEQRSNSYDWNAGSIEPVPVDTCFSGSIRYHNLTEDELGLLLWSTRLEDGCFVSLGGAKPYGYGRIKLEIEGLWEQDPAAQYAPTGLCEGLRKAPAEAVDRYIRCYDAFAAELWNREAAEPITSVRELGPVQDFFYLHSHVMDGTYFSDMPVEASARAELPLPTLRELRTGAVEYPAPAAAAAPKPAAPQSREELMKQLQQKFNVQESAQKLKKSGKKGKWG